MASPIRNEGKQNKTTRQQKIRSNRLNGERAAENNQNASGKEFLDEGKKQLSLLEVYKTSFLLLLYFLGRTGEKKNGKGRKNKDIYGHILLRDAWQSEKGHTIDLAETAWMFVGAIGAWALGWPTTEKDPENNLIDIYDGPTRQCTHDCARQDRYINMYRIFSCRLHREAQLLFTYTFSAADNFLDTVSCPGSPGAAEVLRSNSH